MTEDRTIAIIAIVVGGTFAIGILVVVSCLILRFRYKKWKAANPSKDPRDHSKLFACYSVSCCQEETKQAKTSKDKHLNFQQSVSYKSDGVSFGDDLQDVVINNAERYLETSFTNDAFAKSCDSKNDENNITDVETKTCDQTKDIKDLKLEIRFSKDGDENCELREISPIRKSAYAYSEIDLGRESALDFPHPGEISRTESNDESGEKNTLKIKFWSSKEKTKS